jgi:hypothetical protein
MAEAKKPDIKFGVDENLLKKVKAQNIALKKATNIPEESPTYADHKAVSSDERVKDL